MFTVNQIIEAHSKVKSGADFTNYIKEIKALGVTHYEAYVEDGHIDYHGANGYSIKVPEKYALLNVADSVDADAFKAGLLDHQQGKTDYLFFIEMCAASGIEKWEISIATMSCTYFDKSGKVILVEKIPAQSL